MDRQKLEVIIGHIDDLCGLPEHESELEHIKRVEMIERDRKRRELRKGVVWPTKE